MPHISATKYIEENGLCKTVEEKSGIYAIVLENHVIYVGKAVNMKRRTKMHFRIALNVPERHKYVLLKKAILDEKFVDCVVIKECDISHLNTCEKCCIGFFSCKGRNCPPLNELFGQNSASFSYETFIKELDNYASYDLI